MQGYISPKIMFMSISRSLPLPGPTIFSQTLIIGPNIHFPARTVCVLVKTKMKTDTKMTVVMCCQIVDRKSVAPARGNFWRRSVSR